ncbi:MAG: ABC transporter ATP-binding protein [Acidimicrobiia bacterium]
MTAVERDRNGTLGADANGWIDPVETSPFVPPLPPARYERPTAQIREDRSLSWLRRAMPLVIAHKWMFATSLFCSFVALVIQVQIPAILGEAIDKALVAQTSPLGGYVQLIVVLALVRGVFNFIGRLNLFRTAYRIEYDLRNIVYTHLSTLSFSFYDRVQSGFIISRANSDIRSVQMYLAFAPNIILQCGVAVIAFAKMASIDLPLALVALSPMPFVLWAGIEMRQRFFPVSWLVQARLADVANIVNENINGVRVVKSFAAEQQQLTNLDGAAKRVRWANIRDAQIRSGWAPLLENLPRFGTAFVLFYGGWLVLEGQETVGTIVVFSQYILMLQTPFRTLGMLMMMGRRAAASAGRIYEILDERPEIVDRPGAIDLVESLGDVVFDDVSFDYPNGTPVLHGLDLHLRPGDTVALVGRTGTGKSTVARLLSRFYDVTGGAVRVDGHDVRDLTQVSLRHHIGMVLDEPFLFSEAVRDNIAYGRPDATLDDIVAAAKAAGAHDFILDLEDGYDTVVGERGYTLSGGQRQRIAIARTLLVNPPILVLDDATSAIDVQVEQQIHDALRTLMQGRTTLIIAHRLSTISLADRVAVLDGGRIVAEGTHTELLANEPRYATILAQALADDEEGA